jgi:hypothetical protein
MSRIVEGDCDDPASWLRGYAWVANTKRHLEGAKGQAALKELEAALLALPEKKLLYSEFIIGPDSDDPNGGVCAMAAIALKRKMDTGLSRREAVLAILNEVPGSVMDDSDSEGVAATAAYLGLKHVFAYAVIEQNDEYGGRRTLPEDRYKNILAWVQARIKA